jgi:hypothetical protein
VGLSVKWASLCKLLGVAGLAGVAATGVVAARDERRRRAYTPDEVRARLQERVAAAQEKAAEDTAAEEKAAEDTAGPDGPQVRGRG